jgi:hypothetical protein
MKILDDQIAVGVRCLQINPLLLMPPITEAKKLKPVWLL